MSKALSLSEEEYAQFFEKDDPYIQFADKVNEIQHVQRSMFEIAEVCREVISWVG